MTSVGVAASRDARSGSVTHVRGRARAVNSTGAAAVAAFHAWNSAS